MVIETHAYTHRQGRVGLFTCECGCGQTFFADYKTRHPKYCNKTHRARAYRARSRARASATQCFNAYGYNYDSSWDMMYGYYLNEELSRNRGRL